MAKKKTDLDSDSKEIINLTSNPQKSKDQLPFVVDNSILTAYSKVQEVSKTYQSILSASLWSDNLFNAVKSFSEVSKVANQLNSFNQNKIFLGIPNSDNQIKLVEDEASLKIKIGKLTTDLSKESADKETFKAKTKELAVEIDKLQELIKKKHIISRISPYAEDLLSDESFYENFSDGRECEAIVMSIDIRRSTELMLKARTPKLFSEFITKLSSLLSHCIISNFGIFDKFTGDGILAFFPKFYSGDKAIIRALKAAEECHLLFNEHYNNSKSSFNVFIKDVGLGIGIDYGNVTLVNTSNELTVVGIPVVYACRFSSAKAGDTLLNTPAKEEIERLCSRQLKFTETEIFIKNEGTALAYKVDLNGSVFNDLEFPEWVNESLGENEEKIENENPTNG